MKNISQPFYDSSLPNSPCKIPSWLVNIPRLSLPPPHSKGIDFYCLSWRVEMGTPPRKKGHKLLFLANIEFFIKKLFSIVCQCHNICFQYFCPGFYLCCVKSELPKLLTPLLLEREFLQGQYSKTNSSYK